MTGILRNSHRLAFSLLVLGAVGIGFAPIFVRLSEVGPVATGFYRVLLALPVLWLWMACSSQSHAERRPASLADYRNLVLAGVFFAADLAAWHWSIAYTSVANATLLANAAPIFVTLGARILFAEQFSRRFLTAMTLAMAGVVILLSGSLQLSSRAILGDGLGVLTAIFYAAYILSVSRLRRTFSTATIMVWTGAVTALALAPLMVLSETQWAPLTLTGWGVLLALALVSHAGGQSLIAFALAHLSAAFSSVSLLVQPVVAAFLAWWLLAEGVHGWQWVGGLIVLAGIVLARRASGGT